VDGRRSIVLGVAAALLLLSGESAAATNAASAARPTSRTFVLGAGRATRTFTFRERSGVILLNRLTVPVGVRAFVTARIPHVAGAQVWSWQVRGNPSLGCRRTVAVEVCTQGEEWCPMPAATWHFHLVKIGGPAGPVRFDYLVAPPPKTP
jgi:hypothetical protein